jgi:hypothetical protein
MMMSATATKQGFDPLDLDPFILPFVRRGETSKLPKEPWLYFLIANGKLGYIGQSGNLFNRINMGFHVKWYLQAQDGRVAYFVIKHEPTRKYLEWLYISHFQPEGNGVKTAEKYILNLCDIDPADRYWLKSMAHGMDIPITEFVLLACDEFAANHRGSNPKLDASLRMCERGN